MCTQWRKAHSGGAPSKQLSQETRGVYGYTLVQIACTPLWSGRPPQSSRHRGAVGKSCRYQVAAHIGHIDHTRTSSEMPYFTKNNHTLPNCSVPVCHTTVPQYKIAMLLYHSTRSPYHCTTVQDFHFTIVQDCHTTVLFVLFTTVPQYTNSIPLYHSTRLPTRELHQ